MHDTPTMAQSVHGLDELSDHTVFEEEGHQGGLGGQCKGGVDL
jgi:hypothetical protein